MSDSDYYIPPSVTLRVLVMLEPCKCGSKVAYKDCCGKVKRK